MLHQENSLLTKPSIEEDSIPPEIKKTIEEIHRHYKEGIKHNHENQGALWFPRQLNFMICDLLNAVKLDESLPAEYRDYKLFANQRAASSVVFYRQLSDNYELQAKQRQEKAKDNYDHQFVLADATSAIQFNDLIRKMAPGSSNYVHDVYPLYFIRAVSNDFIGHFKDAINDATEVITLKPGCDSPKTESGLCAYLIRAKSRMKTGDLDGAIEDATQVISWDANRAYAYVIRGEAKLLKSDIEGASQDIQAAFKAHPRLLHANFLNARIKFLNNEFASVIRITTGLIEELRENPTLKSLCFSLRAEANSALGNLEKANQDASTALEWDHFNYLALSARAMTYEQLAAQDVKKLEQLFPKSAKEVPSLKDITKKFISSRPEDFAAKSVSAQDLIKFLNPPKADFLTPKASHLKRAGLFPQPFPEREEKKRKHSESESLTPPRA